MDKLFFENEDFIKMQIAENSKLIDQFLMELKDVEMKLSNKVSEVSSK